MAAAMPTPVLTLPASPMFAPLAERLRELGDGAAWPSVERYNRWCADAPITTLSGRAIRFAAPSAIDDTLNYEQRIHATGVVATREQNWHDLFNALAWATFPRTKAALNASHVAAQATRNNASNRGRMQDALTLFDESGVIVASDDDTLLDALRAMHWKELFWQRRTQIQARMRFVLFGHGLYEQALQPFIGLTGKALLLTVSHEEIALPLAALTRALDARAAQRLAHGAVDFVPEALHPLPILGVPGWWPENENAAFYDNERYFRGRRTRIARTP